jgi:hypothetical protein
MVEVARGAEALEKAAWRVGNLPDFQRRLERAARRVDESARSRGPASLVIYESVLMKSGRPMPEVREKVSQFLEAFDDGEEPMTIPRTSSIMNIEGDSWFFGDPELRTLTGRLLGQFQHRVAQYNYIEEAEVLRRWADSYDTKLFIRRRIYDTEPVAGVVAGFDLPLVQYLRVAAGGDTVVPTPNLARALAALDLLGEAGASADDYEVLAAAEGLALRLELPAPIVGELLEELAYEDRLDFPQPPEPETTGAEDGPEPEGAEAGGEVGPGGGRGGTDEAAARPSPPDRASRREARERADRGEEPTRIQDPQAKDAPGVDEEEGQAGRPTGPRTGPEDAPGRRSGNDQ